MTHPRDPLHDYDPTNESSPDADWCDPCGEGDPDPGPDLTEEEQLAIISHDYGIDPDDLTDQDLRLLRDVRVIDCRDFWDTIERILS